MRRIASVGLVSLIWLAAFFLATLQDRSWQASAIRVAAQTVLVIWVAAEVVAYVLRREAPRVALGISLPCMLLGGVLFVFLESGRDITAIPVVALLPEFLVGLVITVSVTRRAMKARSAANDLT